MSSGFQQQASNLNLNFAKQAPKPQHGQKPDKEVLKREQARTFAPTPPKL